MTSSNDRAESPIMPSRRKLTIAEAMVKRMGMIFSKVSYGDACGEFNEEMVRVLGVKGYFGWAGAASGSLDPLKAKYGGFTSQLLTGFVAMLNGCSYCGKGHLYAANLHYFQDRDQLWGLDENHVYWLQRQRDSEVMEYMRSVLADDKDAETLRLVERLFVIKTEVDHGPDTPDDPWLKAINGAWDWATECSITLSIVDVPALDAIGKDGALVAKYRAARDTWRSENSDHPGSTVTKPWQG